MQRYDDYPYKPLKAPPLTQAIAKPSAACTFTGLDYLGLLLVKTRPVQSKYGSVYLLVFQLEHYILN